MVLVLARRTTAGGMLDAVVAIARTFSSSRRVRSIDDQTIALTAAPAAWGSFAQARGTASLARRG
jgi:hypothetical protein